MAEGALGWKTMFLLMLGPLYMPLVLASLCWLPPSLALPFESLSLGKREPLHVALWRSVAQPSLQGGRSWGCRRGLGSVRRRMLGTWMLGVSVGLILLS